MLEDSTFTRVGASQPIKIDARIVATTNKPLEEAIAAGEFRADLYFWLKVIQIRLPPLRERQTDIPLLCEHFLRSEAAPPPTVRRIPDARMTRRIPREPDRARGRPRWPASGRVTLRGGPGSRSSRPGR